MSVVDAAVARPLPEHLAGLPGTPWSFWRCVFLRSAGFPAHLITRLAAPDCAASADRLLLCEAEVEKERKAAVANVRAQLDLTQDEEQRSRLFRALKQLNNTHTAKQSEYPVQQAYAQACLHAKDALLAFQNEFQRAVEENSGRIIEIAENPLFRQAVLLQNRKAVHLGINVLLRHRREGKKRGKKDRQHEELVANYLQRYAVKNDSIGFFGPVAWARIVSEADRFTLRHGDSLIAHSEVFFENWCIEALAAGIAAGDKLRPWIAPRLLPSHSVQEQKLHSFGRITALPAVHALILKKCDGSRMAKEIAAELMVTPGSGIHSEEQVYLLLRLFESRKIIAWKFEIPVCLHPEQYLQSLLERIDDNELREKALSTLDRLDDAKRNVEFAFGDPEKLDQALEDLECTFTELTSVAATRSAGAMYAGRTLVYQDSCRDLDVEIPPDLIAQLGTPLSLLLTSARWFSYRSAIDLKEKLQQIYQDLLNRNAGRPVELRQLWAKTEGLIFSIGQRPFDSVREELQKRWRQILNIQEGQRRIEYRSEDLRPLVEECFEAPRPGWRLAQYNSPDVMIAASSVDAIRNGDFLFVLGEMHVTTHTVRYSFTLSQHPKPQEMVQAISADLAKHEILPVPPKHWPKATNRTAIALAPPETLYLEVADEPIANASRSKALPIGTLLVCSTENGLEVQTRDGSLRFDLIDFVGEVLSNVAIDMLKIVPSSRHVPRITIDRVVIARESWSFMPEELMFANEEDEHQRYLGARRWMRLHDLPRFVFVKLPIEVKPFYLDFDSPVYVEIFTKMVRRMAASHRAKDGITVSEMLPAPGQLWLADAEGHAYTSEFRMVVRDLAAS